MSHERSVTIYTGTYEVFAWRARMEYLFGSLMVTSDAAASQETCADFLAERYAPHLSSFPRALAITLEELATWERPGKPLAVTRCLGRTVVLPDLSALHTTLRYRLPQPTAFHSRAVLEEHLESTAWVFAFDPARGKMAEENEAFLRDSARVARCERIEATPRDTWARVDDHLTRNLIGNDPVLEAARQASAAAGLPDIHVSPGQGRLLQLLAQVQGARRILEVGTLAAYNTVWLARALPEDGRLVTLEASAKHAKVARGNLERAKLDKVVELRQGPVLNRTYAHKVIGMEGFLSCCLM